MAFLAAAAVVFVSLDIVDAAFGIILAALALYVAAVDLERFEIPDVVNIAIFVFGLIWTVTIFGTHVNVLLAAAVRAVAAAGLLLAVRAVYGVIRGVEGLGLGDVKLARAASGMVVLVVSSSRPHNRSYRRIVTGVWSEFNREGARSGSPCYSAWDIFCASNMARMVRAGLRPLVGGILPVTRYYERYS